MAVNTPDGCRKEALHLIDMSNDAAQRGLRVNARIYFERARTLLLLAKELETDEAKPDTVQ